MTDSKKPFGGSGRKQGDAANDLTGTVRRSPDGTLLAVMWPSPPSPHTWAVMSHYGSDGYEKPERVAHWPVIGAVPGSPAAGDASEVQQLRAENAELRRELAVVEAERDDLNLELHRAAKGLAEAAKAGA